DNEIEVIIVWEKK
nr:Chain B, M-IR2_peptide [Homo sapiens]